MGVKLQSSSGGSVEIAAPVTASNYTLTAPATSSTIDTLARAGNVLQVVNVAYSTSVASSSSTFSDTGLAATITPTSSTSKILVCVSLNGVNKHNISTAALFKLTRNGSPITSIEGLGAYSSVIDASGNPSISFMDSPNTTSSTAYKIQMASAGNVAQVELNGKWSAPFESTSTITLMEIAG